MFTQVANAMLTEAAGGGQMIQMLLPMLILIAVFYFLLIRPENKKKKAWKNHPSGGTDMEMQDILKNLREKNNLTQEQLAERVQVTRQAVIHQSLDDGGRSNGKVIRIHQKDFRM